MKALILMIVTSHAMMGETGKPTGIWFEELSTPYYAFTDAGYDVKIVSVKGGAVPIDPRSMPDVLEKVPTSVARFVKDETLMDSIQNTQKVSDINADDYAAVFLPGGHGVMWDFPNNKDMTQVIEAIYAKGGVVAAVCHGPAGLIGVNGPNGQPIVKGKNVSAFTNSEEAAIELTDVVPFLLETELEAMGAIIKKADDWQPFAVTDGRLVTGQNPASADLAAEHVIKLLEK